MMGVIMSILGMLPGVSSGILSWLNKKTDADLEKFKTGVGADTTINVEEIRARTTLAQGLLAQRAADRDHWFTAWMVPSAFGVSLTHYAAVVLDSVPLFGHVVGSWHVPALPGQYAGMELNIILAICGVAQVASGVRRIFAPGK